MFLEIKILYIDSNFLRGPTDNMSALIQVMAWRWTGGNPLSDTTLRSTIPNGFIEPQCLTRIFKRYLIWSMNIMMTVQVMENDLLLNPMQTGNTVVLFGRCMNWGIKVHVVVNVMSQTLSFLIQWNWGQGQSEIRAIRIGRSVMGKYQWPCGKCNYQPKDNKHTQTIYWCTMSAVIHCCF